MLLATLGPMGPGDQAEPDPADARTEAAAGASRTPVLTGPYAAFSASLVSGRHQLEAAQVAVLPGDAAPPETAEEPLSARVSVPAKASSAVEPVFMVQIGRAPNEPDARTLLFGFLADHGEIFGVLDFVIDAAEGGFRVRAGPFRSRAAADQTCDRIKRRGGPCAVVES